MHYVLGINAYHGDVSAVLVRNGELIAAVEEERFRRIKHWAGFPEEAIKTCLDIAGISGRALTHVAVSRDPNANLIRKALFTLRKGPGISLVLDRLRNRSKVRDVRGPLSRVLKLDEAELPELHFVEHHPAHLASAFLVSPFQDAAVAAVDGFGDFVSTSMAHGHANQLDILDKVYFPHSLGMLYTAITQFLGFRNYGDEFKVMGLAPYGRPEYVDEVRRLVNLKGAGLFELELKYFRHWSEGVDMEWDEGSPSLGRVYSDELESLLGPPRKQGEPVTNRHEDIAHSLQSVFEECYFHVLNGLWERTRNLRLCLAGGGAMNSVANGKIRANTPFEDVYIQPAAADNGTALGAAYWVWHQVLGEPRSFVMNHALWGTEYPEADFEAALRASNESEFAVERFDAEEETCREVARLLAEGNVIGWYQGRMEWGARALGNRSILADPRRADMRDLINTKIKFREKFRPFAPSILEEAVHDYFVDAAPDPFMQQVYPVREGKREELPAITHVDGTGRLQTVGQDTNPKYHRLIREFERITGVPIVLNTSFNENEPIVDTPEQALDTFLRTRMDAIVINDTLIRRVEAASLTEVDADR